MNSGLAPRHTGAQEWPLYDLTQARAILVLAPGADSAILGCGGLLSACFASVGAHVVCVSAPAYRDASAARKKIEISKSITALGGDEDEITWLTLPAPESGQPTDTEAALSEIIRLCRDQRVGTLFAPASEEAQPGDTPVHALATEVTARLGGLRFFEYSVWSRWRGLWTGGEGYVSLEITPWQDRKTAAIAAHQGPLCLTAAGDPDPTAGPGGFDRFFAESPEIYRRVAPG